MGKDFDTRAREAASRLRAVVEDADLRSVTPGAKTHRRAALLRPAWVGAFLLLLGSAVGVAMMIEPSAPEPTFPPTTTTTAVAPTTIPATTIPTSAPVIVATPSTAAPQDLMPPLLLITDPEEGATMSEKTVVFAGVTEPGAEVFAGKYQAEVDGEGNWSIVLVLSEGSNLARFTARDPAGNESQASVTVTYAPPATTTSTTEPEPDEFSAYATFGSCTETPPFDIYYGTGQPGTGVYVESEFGSGTTEVGEDGAWELKVYFETAPPGEGFPVKVFDDLGRKVTLEFVYTP